MSQYYEVKQKLSGYQQLVSKTWVTVEHRLLNLSTNSHLS